MYTFPGFSQTADCAIFDLVLKHLNDDYANTKVDFVYNDSLIDPTAPGEGKYVERTSILNLDFYVEKRLCQFIVAEIDSWFSDIIGDTSISRLKYNQSSDSIINCMFSNDLKYRFTEAPKQFSEEDYTIREVGNDTISYQPTNISFSTILYSSGNQIALLNVLVKVGSGGGGRSGTIYCFIVKKNNDLWRIAKVRTATQ